MAAVRLQLVGMCIRWLLLLLLMLMRLLLSDAASGLLHSELLMLLLCMNLLSVVRFLDLDLAQQHVRHALLLLQAMVLLEQDELKVSRRMALAVARR